MLEAWLLITAFMVSWPFLAFLFLAGIFFEHIESRGMAVFTGLISLVVGYFYLDVSLVTILEWAAGYIVIGLVWSFWRYNSHVSNSIKEIVSSGITGVYFQAKVDALAPGKNIDLITYWILVWPFSAVEHIVSDVIDMVQTLVTKTFRAVYAKIYESKVSGLKPPSVPE